MKALKAGVVPRGRAPKTKGRRKRGHTAAREASVVGSLKAGADANQGHAESWGPLEPVRSIVEPLISMLKPLWSGNVIILIVGLMLYMMFFRSPSAPSLLSRDAGCPGLSLPQRLAAYDEMWRREESELWNWLEDRAGMDGMVFPSFHNRVPGTHPGRSSRINAADEREFFARLREEKVSDREMNHAIRTTRQRLESLEEMMNKRRAQPVPGDLPSRAEL